jgi:uncharacterized protein (DUF885 family)
MTDRAWQYRLERSFYLQLRVGIPVTRLRPRGPDEAQEDAGFAGTLLAELDAIDAHALDANGRLTLAFLRGIFEPYTTAVDDLWYTFPVTPYNLYFLFLPLQHVLAPFAVKNTEDAERFLGLLGDFARLLQVDREILREQQARGIRVPLPALPGVQATLEGLRAGLPAAIAGPDRFAALGGPAKTWVERAGHVLRQEILPALDALIDEASGGEAPDTVGLGQYPGGAGAYRRALRQNTTLDVEPEEVHRLGLEQVALLTERMAEVRARAGFTADEAAFHVELRRNPRLYAGDADEVEARYLAHLRRFEPHVGDFFAVLPKAPYGVKRLDPEAEAGMTYGYYEAPMPNQPVGRYRYNASNLDQRSLLSAAALIYHELIPGHHFHLARQAENERLPAIRREALEIGAFNEGWAEYAASLPEEVGAYDQDPLDRYGRLVHERFTAQRLVVDTGLNALGWPLEEARAYMRRTTFESETQIATETLRYSTDMPGQATAYRMGFLTFRRLRAEAEQALGSRFDLRDFHETILREGALPLHVLEEHIRAYVKDREGAQA